MVQAYKILEKTTQCQTCDFPGWEVVTGHDKEHICWPILWAPQNRHFSYPLNPKWVHFVYVKTLFFHKAHEFRFRQVEFQLPQAVASLNASPSRVPVTRDVCAFMGAQFRCHCLPLPLGRLPPPQIYHLLCVSSPSRTRSSITQNGTLLSPPAV